MLKISKKYSVLYCKSSYFSTKFKEIPTLPSSHPDYGNLVDIGALGSLHEFILYNHIKYGDVFAFYWIKEKVVSLGHPRLWTDIANYFDRPPNLFALFKPLIGERCMQFSNGNEAKLRRERYIQPAFNPTALAEIYPLILETVNIKLLAIWKEAAKSGKKLALHQSFLKAALEIISKGAFCQGLTDQDLDKINVSYQTCWHEMELNIRGSFPELNSERSHNFSNHKQVLQDLAQYYFKKAKSNPKDNKSFISYLKNEEDETMIIQDILLFLIGGFHTTGNLLFWTTYYLSTNPSKLYTLREELNRVMQNDEIVRFDTIPKLKYLRSVINESLRLSKLAPWGARYNLNSETILNREFLVPKGMPIIIPFGKVLGDDRLWERNNEFLPERFSKPMVPFQFCPFGFAGGRVCPGRGLAYIESASIIATLFKNFDIYIHDQSPPDYNYELVTSPKIEIYGTFKKL